MIKKVILCLLVPFAFLLWGCPYDSEVPISEPSMTVYKEWYGLWKIPGEEKSYASMTRYSKVDSLHYRVVYNTWTSEQGSYMTKHFKAHLSRVNGSLFINIQPEMKLGGNYYLFGIRGNAAADTIRLRPLNEEIKEKFSNSDSLRSWLGANMDRKDFFEDEEVFVRVPK